MCRGGSREGDSVKSRSEHGGLFVCVSPLRACEISELSVPDSRGGPECSNIAMSTSSSSMKGWERCRALGVACVRSEVTRVASTKSGSSAGAPVTDSCFHI